jgi:heat-inducible transcriptional repressor
MADEQLVAVTAALTRSTTGSTLADAEVAPTGDAVVDDLARAALDAVRSTRAEESSPVFVGGASRISAAFDAVETVRSVLTTLEQQYVVMGLLRDVLDRGLSVSIGTEHQLESLAECSIVVYPYEVEGQHAGTIGVLGPTRMHYPEALAAVALVSKRLGRHLTEG